MDVESNGDAGCPFKKRARLDLHQPDEPEQDLKERLKEFEILDQVDGDDDDDYGKNVR